MISKIDARHGAFGIVPDELDGAVVSTDFPSFDVNRRKAIPAYIAWVGRTSWFIALCRRASEGSTNRVRLKETRFLAQKIPLPTLAEQSQIVTRLDAGVEAIRSRALIAKMVEAEVAAALRAAFIRVSKGAPLVRMAEIAPLVRRPVAIDLDATYHEIGVRSFGRGLFHKPDLIGGDLTWQSLYEIGEGDLVFSNIKAWEGAFAVAKAEHHGKVGSHRYLNKRDIAINVLCFQVFAHGNQQLLSRSWLLDPVHTQVSAASATKGRRGRESEPWNGEFYASYGLGGNTRSWDEARRYGFISAGGGAWYSNTLNLLNVGDRIWVKAPGHGFLGVGEVAGAPVPFGEFVISTPDGDRPALEVLIEGDYHRALADDPERSEYFVPVRWLHTVPLNEAVNEIGLFGNQNTVCKPTTPKWRTTVERLKERWVGWISEGRSPSGDYPNPI